MLNLTKNAADRGVYIPNITQVDLWRWLDQGSGAFPFFAGAISCSKIGGEHTAQDYEPPILVLSDSQIRFPHPSNNCYKQIVAFGCVLMHPEVHKHGFQNDDRWTYSPKAVKCFEVTKENLIGFIGRANQVPR
jgi:hypothetical protein